MNTCVQAGPLTLSFVAKLNDVKVSTTISFVDSPSRVVELTCLPLTKLTVNGQEPKTVIYSSTEPNGVTLGLPAGTMWVDSDSNPPVLSATTTIQITGGTLTGDQALTSRLRNITASTSDPTGGNNGDIWLKYQA
jgi:hypothetical protein